MTQQDSNTQSLDNLDDDMVLPPVTDLETLEKKIMAIGRGPTRIRTREEAEMETNSVVSDFDTRLATLQKHHSQMRADEAKLQALQEQVKRANDSEKAALRTQLDQATMVGQQALEWYQGELGRLNGCADAATKAEKQLGVMHAQCAKEREAYETAKELLSENESKLKKQLASALERSARSEREKQEKNDEIARLQKQQAESQGLQAFVPYLPAGENASHASHMRFTAEFDKLKEANHKKTFIRNFVKAAYAVPKQKVLWGPAAKTLLESMEEIVRTVTLQSSGYELGIIVHKLVPTEDAFIKGIDEAVAFTTRKSAEAAAAEAAAAPTPANKPNKWDKPLKTSSATGTPRSTEKPPLFVPKDIRSVISDKLKVNVNALTPQANSAFASAGWQEWLAIDLHLPFAKTAAAVNGMTVWARGVARYATNAFLVDRTSHNGSLSTVLFASGVPALGPRWRLKDVAGRDVFSLPVIRAALPDVEAIPIRATASPVVLCGPPKLLRNVTAAQVKIFAEEGRAVAFMSAEELSAVEDSGILTMPLQSLTHADDWELQLKIGFKFGMNPGEVRQGMVEAARLAKAAGAAVVNFAGRLLMDRPATFALIKRLRKIDGVEWVARLEGRTEEEELVNEATLEDETLVAVKASIVPIPLEVVQYFFKKFNAVSKDGTLLKFENKQRALAVVKGSERPFTIGTATYVARLASPKEAMEEREVRKTAESKEQKKKVDDMANNKAVLAEDDAAPVVELSSATSTSVSAVATQQSSTSVVAPASASADAGTSMTQ